MRYRKICIVGLDAFGLLSGEGDLKYIGGETVQHVLLARAWRDLGYDVSIIVFDDGQGARRVVDGITAIAAQSRNGGLPGIKFFHPRASKLFSALAAADADVYYQSPAGAFTGITAWFCRMTGRKFIWTDAEGITSAQGAAATQAERLAVERLVFDSPDQFVLAQIRGASYQTIVSNLRPTDAPDDYTGPLWTMVRINDPQTGQSESPKSAWRIYYINSQSGLIDRVECDVDGQKVEASILQWTEQNGERIPSHIRWTTNGQTLMEYLLTAFSQAE